MAIATNENHNHEHTHDPSGVLGRLLSSNEQWANDVEQAESGFFTEMSKGQAPKVSRESRSASHSKCRRGRVSERAFVLGMWRERTWERGPG